MQDEQILDLFFARDEAAIAVCVRQFGGACMRLALNILHSEPDAEECVSDTWLRAWNAIPPKRPSPLRAYLLRITRNLSINRLRYNRSDCRDQSLTVPFDELDACIPATEENLSELGGVISEFLRSLSSEDRLLFMGRYFHAISVEELAGRMSMKPNTASVRLRRVREALRVYLSERGYSV
jgi:RNA polymerase sigma-70 factor (ECF subfamily)